MAEPVPTIPPSAGAVAKKSLGSVPATADPVPKKSLNVATDAGAGPAAHGRGRQLAQAGLDSVLAAKGGGKPSVSTVLPEGKIKDMASGAELGAQLGGGWGAAAGAAAGSGALGASGTSLARGEIPDADAVKQDLKKGGENAAKGGLAVGTAVAAPQAAFGLAMMAFLNWLKSFFFASIAAALNLGKLIVAILQGVAKAAIGKAAAFFMGIGNGVASALSLSAAAANTVAIGSAVTSVALAVTMVGAGVSTLQETALREGPLGGMSSRCLTVQAAGATTGTTASASELENAKTIYAALKHWGMPDENIAGILGNWSQESRIDPTSVQGIFDEPYAYGPRKQALIASGTTSVGIGLGQWTAARNTLLQNYAKSKGKDWTDLALQLAFMAAGDDAGDVAVFRGMLTKSQGTPSAAALYFHSQWERSADGPAGIARRQANAENWYAQMGSWGSITSTVTDALNSLVNLTGSAVSGAVSAVFGRCQPASAAGLAAGGLTMEQAQQLINLYLQEGDAFLDARYGPNGGPGSCGSDHAMNCVSFSTYFLNKYTSFQQYAAGDGISTASTVARMTGKQTTTTPKAYSIASGPSSTSAGHTFVVLGVTADGIIIGEAGYCSSRGDVRVIPMSEATGGRWTYVDVTDLITDPGIKSA